MFHVITEDEERDQTDLTVLEIMLEETLGLAKSITEKNFPAQSMGEETHVWFPPARVSLPTLPYFLKGNSW